MLITELLPQWPKHSEFPTTWKWMLEIVWKGFPPSEIGLTFKLTFVFHSFSETSMLPDRRGKCSWFITELFNMTARSWAPSTLTPSATSALIHSVPAEPPQPFAWSSAPVRVRLDSIGGWRVGEEQRNAGSFPSSVAAAAITDICRILIWKLLLAAFLCPDAGPSEALKTHAAVRRRFIHGSAAMIDYVRPIQRLHGEFESVMWLTQTLFISEERPDRSD